VQQDLHMDRTLLIEGQEWQFIKERIYRGAVYTNIDRSEFLRVGPTAETEAEVNFVERLREVGYPVGQATRAVRLDETDSYWIEQSIGTETFGERIVRESAGHDEVLPQTIDELAAVLKQWRDAQVREAVASSTTTNWDEFAAVNWLNQSLKWFAPADPPTVDRAIKLLKTTIEGLPCASIATDLNVFNILPGGVIDFEGRGSGPVGYDVMGAAIHGACFPDSQRKIPIADVQIQQLADIAGIESHLIAAFIAAKAFWMAGSSDENMKRYVVERPKFCAWRAQLRDAILQRFVEGQQIVISEIRTELGDIDGP